MPGACCGGLEERRRQDAKREEAAGPREAVHREEARAKQKHDAELERLAEQKRETTPRPRKPSGAKP